MTDVQLIELINNIIREAINFGASHESPFGTNEFEFKDVMQTFLKQRGMADTWGVSFQEYEIEFVEKHKMKSRFHFD